MANKSVKRKKKETDFDKLARLIKGESEDIRGGVADLRSEMRKRFASVDDHLREIRAELADIHRRVERLEEQGAARAGYAKEIDHILQRVTHIEKHLNIKGGARK